MESGPAPSTLSPPTDGLDDRPPLLVVAARRQLREAPSNTPRPPRDGGVEEADQRGNGAQIPGGPQGLAGEIADIAVLVGKESMETVLLPTCQGSTAKQERSGQSGITLGA